MVHGIDGYFLERARATRRVATVAVAVGGTLLVALLSLARTPAVQNALRVTVSMGYEGRAQYVERLSIQKDLGNRDQLRDVGALVSRGAARGGAPSASERDRRPNPNSRPQLTGPGDALSDLLARSIQRAANIPVLQSEELVIDHAVVPVYPEPLREQNVEGRVTLQALIDVEGKVVDVAVLSSTGEPLFEQAATAAVLQYRFRPYQISGSASEVYAVVRFAFRLY